MPSRPPRLPYKDINVRPVDGPLDTRLTGDLVPLGGYRYLESVECPVRGQAACMSGTRRHLDEEFNNNADLHDQLLTLAGRTLRQPPIFLYEHELPEGGRKLFAATANTLYALNNSTGNWKIIGDNFSPAQRASCPEVRWSAAGFGNVVVFSNGVDPVVGHIIDQPADPVTGQSVFALDDLALLNITRVGFVVQFAGLTIFCNVVADGVRQTYGIVWSDYENPLSVKPKASASLAGDKHLDFGEVLLGAEELNNSLMLYTSMGNWQADVSSDGLIFSRRFKADERGSRTLVYPRTLVSTGNEHYYMGRDGIYVFSQYVTKPERIDWIHSASGRMFAHLDASRCLAHCAGHEAAKKQVWFSWAKTGEACPMESMVINTEFPFVSYLPEGYCAFGSFGFARQQSVRDFLVERCVCAASDLDRPKEGGYCTASDGPVAGSCAIPASIYTSRTVDLDGRSVEDLTARGGNDPDADSFCAGLAGLIVEDLCAAEGAATACEAETRFLLVSSRDWCIKERVPDIYYRELCTDFAAGGCGSYTKARYPSIMRSGPLDFSMPEAEKLLQRFGVEVIVALTAVPSKLWLKVGSAAQAHDPNEFDPDGRCVIMYAPSESREMKCLSSKSATEHALAGTRPDEDIAWAIHMQGRYLYYELTVDQATEAFFSRFSLRVAALAASKR